MYSYTNLVDHYRTLGVKKGMVVMLKADLTRLGPYHKNTKDEILKDHLRALDEVLDFDHGTVVVATSSTNLCNTALPYNPKETPSVVGVLTEHIRKHPQSVRSYHAFESYCALGKHAEEICCNVSRYAYGIDTPEDRVLKYDGLCISMGIEPNRSCASVHHLEAVCAVPYRYVKEYRHPVVISDVTKTEKFYRYVWYENCGIKRDTNKMFFKKIIQDGFRVKEVVLGKGKSYCYSLTDFFQIGKNAMLKDPYIWLSEPPHKYPWRE